MNKIIREYSETTGPIMCPDPPSSTATATFGDGDDDKVMAAVVGDVLLLPPFWLILPEVETRQGSKITDASKNTKRSKL